ncbi:type III PLP-dependent enzyme [Sneathiella aquimaris]|uniref:type III PLP-dependent enzyme n=2 Tax=Sneathiella aquimaris TaxID=2599305 RepID=UPI001CA497AB|nr:type III PLP-dependent enzyme [Sneathiella aquimaris]
MSFFGLPNYSAGLIEGFADMVRPSQPKFVAFENSLHRASDLCALTDLRVYRSPSDAIVTEECEDALHLLSREKVRMQASLFRDHFKGKSMYAVKSNPHMAVLKLLWDEGIRDFEVASLREVKYVLGLFPEATLYFMHPVKSRRAIREACAMGVRHFAFDGLEELKKIEIETAQVEGLHLYLRVQVEQKTAVHPLNGKFGASIHEAPLLLQRASLHASRIGVTFHVGSQCMDPQDYGRSIHQIAAMLSSSGIPIDRLDVGGGFPVYYPGMDVQPLTSYFDAIDTAIQSAGLADVDIICEPGRALIAEAGSVAVRVELRKGKSLYLNDGTYGSLFDAGISKWPYPLEVYSSEGALKAGPGANFQLYGPTCDSLDVMRGPFQLDATINEGDWILFQNLGAYGYAMQTQFNGFYSETVVAID